MNGAFSNRVLSRYLWKHIGKNALIGCFVAQVVLVILQIIRLSDFLIRSDFSLKDLAVLCLGLSVSFTPLLVPIAFLFSLLSVFGRMSTDREFVACFSMGLSARSVLKPVGALAVVFALLSWLAAVDVGPRGNRLFEATLDAAYKKKVTAVLRSGTFSEDFLGMVLFVDRVNPATEDLERVFLFDERSFEDQTAISAERGRWVERVSESRGVLELYNGVMVSQGADRSSLRRVKFDQYRIFADFSKQAGAARDSPASATLARLWSKAKEEKAKDKGDPRPFWLELSRRFSLAFACFLFAPLALVLSLDNSRTAKSRAVFIGLVVVFSYWTAYFSIVTLVLKSSWRVLYDSMLLTSAAVWIPNVLLAAAALVWIVARKQKALWFAARS